LIEHDDEGQPRTRRVRPIVQLAARLRLQRVRKLLRNGGIRATAKPELELLPVRLLVGVQARRKPEIEDVLRLGYGAGCLTGDSRPGNATQRP
jgi:hypothetical protein